MARSRQMWTAWLAVMLIITIVLAGCGASGKSSKESQSSQNGQSTQNKDTSLNGNKAAVEASGTRIVRDEFGEVEIPVKAQRVAAIYLEDYLTALEVTPVVQWYHPNWGKQDYLALDVPTFDITGSMEALLEASPDLILVDGAVDAAQYELYSKVAPTYRLQEGILQNPREILRTIADVLGIPEKAESVISQYEQNVANAKAKLEKATGDETVAVLRLNVGDKTLTLFGIENRYTGNIYKELGLTPHPFARDMKEFQTVLSEEVIPELDAEHIIIFPSNGTWTSEENQEAVKLLESPLWKSVPAVKKGQVYSAERTHWQSGAITANMMKIDDLLKWFIK